MKSSSLATLAHRLALFALLAGPGLTACDSGKSPEEKPAPFASTYEPLPAENVLLRNATVLTGTGERLDGADVLLRDGRIGAVGTGLDAAGAEIFDAGGMWITPGIIDVHSHLGVYPSPSVDAHADGNELTSPNTAEVWAEHSVWPQDPGFVTALAGGITSLQILPGSANLFGGRSVCTRLGARESGAPGRRSPGHRDHRRNRQPGTEGSTLQRWAGSVPSAPGSPCRTARSRSTQAARWSRRA